LALHEFRIQILATKLGGLYSSDHYGLLLNLPLSQR